MNDTKSPHRMTVILPERVSRGIKLAVKKQEITSMSQGVINMITDFLKERDLWDHPEVLKGVKE